MSDKSGLAFAKLSLADRTKYLEQNKEDCSFIVRRECFKSYKNILMEASSVFKNMFKGKFKEYKDSFDIQLEDVDPTDFEKFLSFIYFNTLENASISSLKNLYTLAIKYDVPTLMEESKKNLLAHGNRDKLSCGEMFELFDFAYVHGCDEIDNGWTTTSCFNQLCEQIIEKQKEKPDLFTRNSLIFHWQEDVFSIFLNKCVLKNNLGLKFYLIEIYAKVNRYDEKRFKKLLKLVNFKEMTDEDFYDGPATSKFLSPSEKFNLAMLTKKTY